MGSSMTEASSRAIVAQWTVLPHVPTLQLGLSFWQSNMALMGIGVTTLAGSSCRVIAEESWTVRDLKAAVKEQLRVPIDEQSMILGITPVVDSSLISALQDSTGEGGLEFTMLRVSEEMGTWIRILSVASHYSRLLDAPVYAGVCGDGNVLNFVPEICQRDRDIVIAAVKQNCQMLENIAEEFRADREVTRLAVRSTGKLLQHAAKELMRIGK